MNGIAILQNQRYTLMNVATKAVIASLKKDKWVYGEYFVSRNGVDIWVANGPFYCNISGTLGLIDRLRVYKAVKDNLRRQIVEKLNE